MEAFAVLAYTRYGLLYITYDEQKEAVEHADFLWDMCNQGKVNYRFLCVAQVELDDNGKFSIHGAVPIKNYKIRKRVLIKNKIKNLLNFLKRKG